MNVSESYSPRSRFMGLESNRVQSNLFRVSQRSHRAVAEKVVQSRAEDGIIGKVDLRPSSCAAHKALRKMKSSNATIPTGISARLRKRHRRAEGGGR